MKNYCFIAFFTILILGRLWIPKLMEGTMETSDIILIVVAIISLIGVVVSSHLSENSRWKSVNEKLEHIFSSLNEKISTTNENIGVDKNRVCLSRQHEDMKNSLSHQNREIKSILDSGLNSANSKLEGLYSKMQNDEKEASVKKAVLAASGHSLDEFVNDIRSFSQLYADEIKKNIALSAAIEKLEIQNTELSKSNSALKSEIESLKRSNSKLKENFKTRKQFQDDYNPSYEETEQGNDLELKM